MPFVKLDCGILNSTLWVEREPRDLFITSLLMAEPIELKEPTPQYRVRGFDKTGFVIPPGWYGFVPAAGQGIARMAMVETEAGLMALEKLGNPDPESRTPDFEGRRLVRVEGGYVVLNFMKYRDRDYTGADRARRYRERQKALSNGAVTRDGVTSHRDITQAEAELEAEEKPKARKTKAAVAAVVSVAVLVSAGFDEGTANEFISHKQRLKAPLTERAWQDHQREAAKAGWTSMQAAERVMARGWKGFDASYVKAEAAPKSETAYQRSMRKRVEEFAPGIAARAPAEKIDTQLVEVIDVTPRRLG